MGRALPSLLLGAAAAALLFCEPAEPDEPPHPIGEYFGEFRACALVVRRDRYDESHIEFNPEQCDLPLSPCSTFKIPNALIGLQTGAVTGPGHHKTWDGTLHSRKINNRDHTLATAIEHSVVWYFQSLARDVGEHAMVDWLQRLDYGNRDISGGIDRFWLGSSLEISARRQLDLVRSLWRSSLPFDQEHQRQVREMLAQDSDLPGLLHGKTGSCLGNPAVKQPDHGWFMGWVEWDKNRDRNPATTWFVINISGHEAGGSEARRIALQLLADLQP
jgi:beta-lactamase class D